MKRTIKNLHTPGVLIILGILLMMFSGCSNNEDKKPRDAAPEKSSSLELKYADQFSVDFYENNYCHIHIKDGSDYVLIPDGAADTDLGFKGATIIHRPLNNIYLAASSAMDFFVVLDCLSDIGTCSTSASDYTIEEAKRAIDDGSIIYVGKYSAPDYETILSNGCTLAIESTMISHSPDIKEELERLGIPVLVERSSYENSPIGRLEWIKLYGILLGKEKEADAFFAAQEEKLYKLEEELKDIDDKNRPSVAFFYISSNGYVNVRKPGDYISTMIEMAGGTYCLDDINDETKNALSTMNINWEEFYEKASDADILIYNGTIDGGIKSTDDLIDKNALFADFKAVKNGKVFCTNADMYQKSSSIVDVLMDLYRVINEKDTQDLTFIYSL